jgi:hypothetical protein
MKDQPPQMHALIASSSIPVPDRVQHFDTKDIIIKQLLEQNEALIKQQTDNINQTNQTNENIKKILDQNETLIKTVSAGTTINNTTNKFKLNIFLNETCKNAINLNDFIRSIVVKLEDVIQVGNFGFVDGIANIAIDRLNQLGETNRPIHCIDQKRDIICVKNEGKWEKDLNNSHIHRLVDKVSLENQKGLSLVRVAYPDYQTTQFNIYNKIKLQAICGDGDYSENKKNRIVRLINKHISIKK